MKQTNSQNPQATSQEDNLPFDPAWYMIRLHARLRRSEQKRNSGVKKQLCRLAGKVTRWSNSALIRLAVWDAANPWLDKQGVQAIRQERAKLLDALSGRIKLSANGAKLYLGELSPGCAICMAGYWGCNYINGRCQRTCFYCMRYHSMLTEPDCRTDSFSFRSPAEHINYLKTFRIKGVGFSGGEPLLAPERLLSHIVAIRREFGPSMYLWMYTNGDLVNREILSELKAVGLNEMRFDLSARDYEMSPLRLAREYIPTVTVEIPAIPEDFPVLRELLGELQAIGVNHLNLHQLVAARRNWRAYCQRHYHFSIQQLPTVYESELCALRLLLYACEQQLRLPINYCSYAYRSRYYARALRLRSALVAVSDTEEITEAGYIRAFWVSDTTERIQELVQRLQSERVEPKLWKVDHEHGGVAVHGSLLPYVNWPSARLTTRYYQAAVSLREPALGFNPDNLKVERNLVRTEPAACDGKPVLSPSKYEKLETGLAAVV